MIYPQPKPRRIVEDRVEEKRVRAMKSAEFRRQVWKRDGNRCQHCGRRVIHTLENLPNRGEVHHRKTRGAHPDLRYLPENGILLCCVCHSDPDVIARFR